MAKDDLLLFEKRGHVAYLTLNRPEKRNPLGLAGDGEAFAEAARRINGDFDIRISVTICSDRTAKDAIDFFIARRTE